MQRTQRGRLGPCVAEFLRARKLRSAAWAMRAGSVSPSAGAWITLPLQRWPPWSPGLRRGLPDRLPDFVRRQPLAHITQFRRSRPTLAALQLELARRGRIRDHHASIFVCPSIPATLYASILPLSGSAWGAWRDNFKHPFALRFDSVTRLGGAHSFLQSQAPDHTASRPQPIHCRLLDRAIHLIGCSTDSAPVFIPVPGPQAPGDSLERLTLPASKIRYRTFETVYFRSLAWRCRAKTH